MPNRTRLPGLSALPEYMACLSIWCPYSVDPEAEPRLTVWGQLTCCEEGNKSKKKKKRDEMTVLLVCMLLSLHTLKWSAESPKNMFAYSYIFLSHVCVSSFKVLWKDLECNVDFVRSFCWTFIFALSDVHGFWNVKTVRKQKSNTGQEWSLSRDHKGGYTECAECAGSDISLFLLPVLPVRGPVLQVKWTNSIGILSIHSKTIIHNFQ